MSKELFAQPTRAPVPTGAVSTSGVDCDREIGHARLSRGRTSLAPDASLPNLKEAAASGEQPECHGLKVFGKRGQREPQPVSPQQPARGVSKRLRAA